MHLKLLKVLFVWNDGDWSQGTYSNNELHPAQEILDYLDINEYKAQYLIPVYDLGVLLYQLMTVIL